MSPLSNCLTPRAKAGRAFLLVLPVLLILLMLLLSLSACGGGGGATAVTNLSASGMRFGSNLVITVNGAGLDDPGLQMQVAGPCDNISRSTVSSDSQTSFSCRLTGVGPIEPSIRTASGSFLASIKIDVPVPQVSMTVTQGTRTGTMLIELDPVVVPATVRNFLDYVNGGFYRNTIFHRVVGGQLAQGGGYTAGPTFKPPVLAPIALQSNLGLSNLRGTIAMARTSEPDSASSQFYFNVKDNPDFDYISPEQPGYAVFGRIISGLVVLDELGQVPTRIFGLDFPALPIQDVLITAITQVR